jgi:hypothetical protein
MPSTRTRGNSRTEMYLFDAMLGKVHRSAIGSIWRWRTEAGLVAACGGVITALVQDITVFGASVVVMTTATVLAIIPQSRRYIKGWFWCVVTRHRLQRLCWEVRLHTRAGRLPLILRVRPTEVGERVTLWCRAGVSAEDFEAHSDEIRTACYAMDARITRNKEHSQLVTIDVMRRDTLHAKKHVMPHVIPGTVVERTEEKHGRTRDLARRIKASLPRWLRRTEAAN